MLCKSLGCFLYDRDLRHETVKHQLPKNTGIQTTKITINYKNLKIICNYKNIHKITMKAKGSLFTPIAQKNSGGKNFNFQINWNIDRIKVLTNDTER